MDKTRINKNRDKKMRMIHFIRILLILVLLSPYYVCRYIFQPQYFNEPIFTHHSKARMEPMEPHRLLNDGSLKWAARGVLIEIHSLELVE